MYSEKLPLIANGVILSIALLLCWWNLRRPI